jgi:Protein of unknown function (DUF3443)
MLRLIGLVPVAVLMLISACGGGGSGGTLTGGGGGGTTSGSNVAPITVDAGPTQLGVNQKSVNTPFISVTVCSPNSSTNCETIDHIEVDNGSFGLRLISEALPASFTLPHETDANNDAIYECAVFGDGFAWGSVALANVQVAGETATNIPVQIIGDAASGTPPSSCSSMNGTDENTVASFGANGIIGVGPFIQDEQSYYSCPSNVCGEINPLDDALQVSNPVASFATDNNGVIIQLPSVAPSGATALSGSLIFGIGTQSNNGLGSAAIYTVVSSGNLSGTLSITYNSTTYSGSFIDSGSNALYLIDSTIPTCPDTGFYCPTSTLSSLMSTITGTNGASAPFEFSVANADNLFTANPSGVAFVNLGAPNTFGTPPAIDFGLPFFFNRKVYTAIADATTPGGIGPFFAF